MPDWSYHPLKKLLLNKMRTKTSREFIHNSMSTIASLPGGRGLIGFLGHMKPPRHLQKEIFDTTFPSPVGLSSHIDPQLSGINAFQELGFGFIEIGPIVLKEPEEQKEPRREKSNILFSDHPEKIPLKLAIKKLISLNIEIPIMAKIDEQVNKSEWDLIVQHLTPFVDGFIGTSEQVKSFVNSSLLDQSYFISFSADEINKKVVDNEQLLPHSCVRGIVIHAPSQSVDSYWQEVTNATSTLAKTVKQVKDLHPELIVITSGGVEKPDDACALIRAGTDLLMLSDGYVNAGPGLPKRIHEKLVFAEVHSSHNQRWYWSFMFGLAILIGGIIAFYFALTDIILPYDESFMGLTRDELLLINPRILAFMSHDRMALAGTMISGGILYIQLARYGLKSGMHWAKIAFHSAALTGFLGILLFIGFGYFDWLHGLFWLILLPIYYLSFREGKEITDPPYSSHGTNDSFWQYGLYGQLMFILLGFMIVIGGFVISTIGVSNVFVSTDISFLCMSPEMLDRISTNLIPVIAHDRAGFGSALVSVGLLVLMISLWGFRRGERWVWNTLCLGALPAFIAGIGTHIFIGYTTFIHLLPVYFLVLLYVLGLVFSYPFLKRN